ncbi:MAG: hypothetical protein EAZ07_08120 [Cytophagales bacterium]|nr:MAG: hypothetical protein EAZ07_08120 [Cytophagales bacterium]
MNQKLVIEQKRGRQLRKYQILDDEIKAELRTDSTYRAFSFKFDDIEFNEMVVDTKPNPVEIGLFLSVLFNLMFSVILISDWAEKMQIGTVGVSSTLIGVVSGMSIWTYNLFRFEREKILKGTQNIFLFYSKKDQQEVDDFIQVLKNKQKEYFRKTYMYFDDTLDLWTYESRLKWLLEKRFIEKEEYKNLQEEITNRRLLGD